MAVTSPAGKAFELAFGEAFHAPLLAQHVERAVATHSEQPFRHVIGNRLARLGHEPDERILHDVARPFRVADEPCRITQQRRLMPLDGGWKKIISVCM